MRRFDIACGGGGGGGVVFSTIGLICKAMQTNSRTQIHAWQKRGNLIGAYIRNYEHTHGAILVGRAARCSTVSGGYVERQKGG